MFYLVFINYLFIFIIANESPSFRFDVIHNLFYISGLILKKHIKQVLDLYFEFGEWFIYTFTYKYVYNWKLYLIFQKYNIKICFQDRNELFKFTLVTLFSKQKMHFMNCRQNFFFCELSWLWRRF